MGYLRQIRVLYVTLSDKYAKPGSMTASDPKGWAQWAVEGEVVGHVLILCLTAIHLFGPPPQLSKSQVFGGALVFGAAVVWLLRTSVFSESKIQPLRTELQEQPRADAAMRRFGVGTLRLVSFILLLVLLYSLDLD
jgi:hypothetical protein